MYRLNLAKNTDELKRLIAEHPDYPIVVLVGDASYDGESIWTYCSTIRFEVCELLDAEYYDYDDTTITDRDRLEELIEDRLYDSGLEGDELDVAVKAKVAEFEPYWIDVIAIFAEN